VFSLIIIYYYYYSLFSSFFFWTKEWVLQGQQCGLSFWRRKHHDHWGLHTCGVRVQEGWKKHKHTKRKMTDFLSDKVRAIVYLCQLQIYIILISHVRHKKKVDMIILLGSKTKEDVMGVLNNIKVYYFSSFPQVFWVMLLLIATHKYAHIPCNSWPWVMEFGHSYNCVFYLQNFYFFLINSLIVETLI
jgi:hypothetical protein